MPGFSQGSPRSSSPSPHQSPGVSAETPGTHQRLDPGDLTREQLAYGDCCAFLPAQIALELGGYPHVFAYWVSARPSCSATETKLVVSSTLDGTARFPDQMAGTRRRPPIPCFGCLLVRRKRRFSPTPFHGVDPLPSGGRAAARTRLSSSSTAASTAYASGWSPRMFCRSARSCQPC